MVDKPKPEATVKPESEGVPTNLSKDLMVELVMHDARHIDVRFNGEIRRIKDKALAKEQNKLGGKFLLDESVWQKAEVAPYAKRKKK